MDASSKTSFQTEGTAQGETARAEDEEGKHRRRSKRRRAGNQKQERQTSGPTASLEAVVTPGTDLEEEEEETAGL